MVKALFVSSYYTTRKIVAQVYACILRLETCPGLDVISVWTGWCARPSTPPPGGPSGWKAHQ